MPLHDWSRVPAGLFHHFHQSWTIRIADALNAGRLPKGISALVEQFSGGREADVLAVGRRGGIPPEGNGHSGGVATLQPPVTRFVHRSADNLYASRANRIVIKHHLGRKIAVIKIVSPGNKDRRGALREFVEKTVEYLQQGIHVLVVDLFPPTPRDPAGIHKAIWDEVHEEAFVLPPGKDRTLVAYETINQRVAYVEPVGVGDLLPNMPLFLSPGLHVPVPLEATYQATWDASSLLKYWFSSAAACKNQLEIARLCGRR